MFEGLGFAFGVCVCVRFGTGLKGFYVGSLLQPPTNKTLV